MRRPVRSRMLRLTLGGALILVLAGAAATEEWSKSFPLSGAGRLEFSARNGDVRVQVWERKEIRIEAKGVDPARIEARQQGDRVVFSCRERERHAGFSISVPPDVDLELKTGGGDVEVVGKVEGAVGVSTAGGDIRIEDTAGTTRLKTAGGDIEAGTLGGEATLKTAGGDIRIRSAAGRLSLETAGGDIAVGKSGADVTARSAGGGVELGSVSGDARASTAGGDIRVGEVSGSASLRTAGGDIELAGSKGTVEAKTAGGDLRLRQVRGSVKGRTAGGDIEVELYPAAQGESGLETAGGSILLSLDEGAAASIEAVIRVRGNWTRGVKRYRIRSDFPVRDRIEDRAAREIRAFFDINGGGHPISLRTVNDDIVIRRIERR